MSGLLVLCTHHRGVESRPAGPVHRATLVGLGFAGGDQELNLIRIGGHFHVGQGLSPSGGADQPHEGEHHGHHKVLTPREGEEEEEDTREKWTDT